MSASQPAASLPTVVCARLRPLAASSATAAWLFMCGSIPITITFSPPLVGCNRCEWGPAADTP